MDVGQLLRELGLARYEPAFRENKINGEVLSSLTAQDLMDLGVILARDRGRLLQVDG